MHPVQHPVQHLDQQSYQVTYNGDTFQVWDSNIKLDQLLTAQRNWCNSLLDISHEYRRGGIGPARQTAERVLNTLYRYDYGPVAFKPTMASGEHTFRPTRDGALSYFVGHNEQYPTDAGFALKPWETCSVDNSVVQLYGSFANTMGQVRLTDTDGNVTTVDKTWSYMLEPDGHARINVHHSSLPYTPNSSAPYP